MKPAIVLLILALGVFAEFDNMPTIPGDDSEIIRGKRNDCSYYAVNQDMLNLGLWDAAANYCELQTGEWPAGVSVNNDDGFPWKTCISVTYPGFSMTRQNSQQQTFFRNFTNPSTKMRTRPLVVRSTYVNTASASTTNAVNFATGFNYEIAAPSYVSTVTPTLNFKTDQQSTCSFDEPIDFNNKISYKISPYCWTAVSGAFDVATYQTTINVPVCMSGYVRCNYNHRVKDHYLWYVWWSNFATQDQLCRHQTANLTASVATSQGKVSVTQGVCN